jgi:tRNA pseudouridine38-40 synthase
MRLFVELAYDGTKYSGWQKQPNASSIQEVLENSLSTILQENIEIVGCGRTDAGVHALSSYFHFDTTTENNDLKHKLNLFLPKEIAVNNIVQVNDDAHARFDATKRSYVYKIHRNKDPFLLNHSYFFPQFQTLDFSKMKDASLLLLEFDEFFTFCKTRTDVKTMKCQLFESKWEVDDDYLNFHISADRFLRGMVRLIVGMCLNVAQGKIELESVRTALENQTRLERDLSVPACGLYLSKIVYPYIDIA